MHNSILCLGCRPAYRSRHYGLIVGEWCDVDDEIESLLYNIHSLELHYITVFEQNFWCFSSTRGIVTTTLVSSSINSPPSWSNWSLFSNKLLPSFLFLSVSFKGLNQCSCILSSLKVPVSTVQKCRLIEPPCLIRIKSLLLYVLSGFDTSMSIRKFCTTWWLAILFLLSVAAWVHTSNTKRCNILIFFNELFNFT